MKPRSSRRPIFWRVPTILRSDPLHAEHPARGMGLTRAGAGTPLPSPMKLPFPRRDPWSVAHVQRLVLLVGWWLTAVIACPGAAIPVHHEPRQPRSGQAVRITIGPGLDMADAPVLEYQIVPPGKYVARADSRFEREWIRQALTPADGGGLTAELPAAVQENRRLIRYRVRAGAGSKQLLPPAGDEQGNFAYFVYDGVPAWQGAVNPNGEGAAREVNSFPPQVLTNVPVYHLIAASTAVEEAMWKPKWDRFSEDARHAYRHTGTFVYGGTVYDHVKFRARGGSWRHAMGKNMWKFNFNPGHRLAARDAYGRPYAGKWDKLNLGACIQQGDYGMRGEQGMFEAVTFRLFNLAGSEAPRTHWVHFRVITEAEETPSDQYRGDFWGLYLAVEEIDGDFLKEHALPDGNLYKIEGFQPHPEHVVKGAPADGADAQEFIASVMGGGGRRFSPWRIGGNVSWAAAVDLERYYSYRSIVEATHHYDIGSGKNYFFYHNLKARRWQVIPWDVDLSWGDRMYGDGNEPFLAAGLLRQSPYREQYQQRLAELRDLLLNPEQMDRLIDEHAAMIWNGDDALSLADADRAKWDYHPIMSSSSVMSGKTDPGLFYFRKPSNRFGVMPALMKTYVRRRQAHLDRLLEGYRPPTAPGLSGPKSVSMSDESLRLTASPAAAGASGFLQWRLAEVSDPGSPGFNPRKPWPYEVEPIWQAETTGMVAVAVPLKGLAPGHTYRVRVRSLPGEGLSSRWSDPVEFVVR